VRSYNCQAWRLDRFRSDNPLWSHHWRRSHRRCRKRGHQGRSCGSGSCRQSRARVAPSKPNLTVQMNVRVPFVDLRVQHEPLMPELIDAFCRVTESTAFAGGPFVARFEAEFAAFWRACRRCEIMVRLPRIHMPPSAGTLEWMEFKPPCSA